MREQEGGTVPAWGVGTSRREEEVGKGYKRVNMVKIMHPHAYKWKNDTY
jgi:hypothetical protein